MSILSVNLNFSWCSAAVEELVRNGIDYFVISPGSRSTPLAVAVARNSRTRKMIAYDERAAGFHALGYARASGQPAVLISTSGTAVANYLPAVIEASISGVPMLLFTADRPPELRDTGANQTIRQPGIFGDYVRWSFDMPAPTEIISIAMVLTTVDQAIYRAQRAPAGPVHVNWMFREPLAPLIRRLSIKTRNSVRLWEETGEVFTRYPHPRILCDVRVTEEIAAEISSAARGILVLGELPAPAGEQMAGIIRKLRWPVFADVTSGWRFQKEDGVIHHFDQLLHSPSFRHRMYPQVILHLGGRITSKRYWQFVEESQPLRYIMVKNSPDRLDPVHQVSWQLEADINGFIPALISRIESAVDEEWREDALKWNRRAARLIEQKLAEDEKISEPWIARNLPELVPDGNGLFLSNSLAVREVDMFGKPVNHRLRVAANRGASGIDGIIASATGFAAGLAAPVTLLIGDLAFLHDLNSLHLVKTGSAPITIVLVNNRGGGIFSFLPIREFREFDTYFTTPHSYRFRSAAQQFGLPYTLARTKSEFLDALQNAHQSDKSSVIEVQTDADENYRLQELLAEKLGRSPGKY